MLQALECTCPMRFGESWAEFSRDGVPAASASRLADRATGPRFHSGLSRLDKSRWDSSRLRQSVDKTVLPHPVTVLYTPQGVEHSTTSGVESCCAPGELPSV